MALPLVAIATQSLGRFTQVNSSTVLSFFFSHILYNFVLALLLYVLLFQMTIKERVLLFFLNRGTTKRNNRLLPSNSSCFCFLFIFCFLPVLHSPCVFLLRFYLEFKFRYAHVLRADKTRFISFSFPPMYSHVHSLYIYLLSYFLCTRCFPGLLYQPLQLFKLNISSKQNKLSAPYGYFSS